ncbi:MAG: TolC family protein, partial [Candidatus Accumulibacter sp.]|uniref:TolC family protein n=1 Tax=Accumulibacter sp. TaxID=2053492 RepID=UPI00287B1A72
MRCSLQALAAATLVLSSTGVLAGGLLDAYLAARANDPTFRAARYEREAGQQAIAIGRSSLLPVVAISASYSKNRGERQSTTSTPDDLDYADKQAALTLRQPLFNYEAFVRKQQGGVQAAYSDAVFDRKEGEMTVKLAAAYFEALFSGERLTLAEAEITAYEAQRELAQRRRKGGEGTVTEVAEAESRMQLARAGRADAADRLLVATHALAVMTGKPSGRLWVLRPDFVAPALQPAGIEEWLALAENNSPELRA